jgi:hypothetical protein
VRAALADLAGVLADLASGDGSGCERGEAAAGARAGHSAFPSLLSGWFARLIRSSSFCE